MMWMKKVLIPITVALNLILKLKWHFKETKSLKDRPWRGRSFFSIDGMQVVQSVAVLVKLRKYQRFQNDQFKVFCTETENSIRTKFRHFSNYYRQIQKWVKALLQELRRKWNLTYNGCWTLCEQIKTTFQCTMTSVQLQIFLTTWPGHWILLMRLFCVVLRRLLFWDLPFLNNLVLYSTWKPVQSLQKFILSITSCVSMAENKCVTYYHFHKDLFFAPYC